MIYLRKTGIYFWAIWCAVVFCLVMICLFPFLYIPILFKNKNWIRKAHFAPPIAAKIGLKWMGIKVIIHHPECIDPAGQYVYISNHRSYLDALLAAAVIPNYMKFLGKAEILSWPIFGFLLKNYYVPVWRNDKEHRAWSMHEMEEKIKTGCSFFICPEGTCNTTENFFNYFHDGAFRLAKEANLPLIPLTFVGAGERMPRNEYLIYPGEIQVFWHKPIPPSEIDLNHLEEFKTKIKSIMEKELKTFYPSGKYKID